MFEQRRGLVLLLQRVLMLQSRAFAAVRSGVNSFKNKLWTPVYSKRKAFNMVSAQCSHCESDEIRQAGGVSLNLPKVAKCLSHRTSSEH